MCSCGNIVVQKLFKLKIIQASFHNIHKKIGNRLTTIREHKIILGKFYLSDVTTETAPMLASLVLNLYMYEIMSNAFWGKLAVFRARTSLGGLCSRFSQKSIY